ncbi:MAG: polysaccharide deacetylase family protein [Clostridiales bacterium]|nr:polysaccharide deacetylase family protein [Clostridiales bacterium]
MRSTTKSFTKIIAIIIILTLPHILAACNLSSISIFSPGTILTHDPVNEEREDPPNDINMSENSGENAGTEGLSTPEDEYADEQGEAAQEPTKNAEAAPVEDGQVTPEPGDNLNIKQDPEENPKSEVESSENPNGGSAPNEEPNAKPVSDEKPQAGSKPSPKIIRSATDKELKQVAITFDDGPDGRFTPQVLDVLKAYDVKATFFVIGSVANDNRDILKRIHEEGHVIGSHSWGHKNFTKISEDKAIDELKKTNNIIEEITGKTNTLFRLPYGAFNDKVLNTIAGQGFYNIYWSIDPKDWSGNSSKSIFENVQKNLNPGAIILLHSAGSSKSIPNSIDALPKIIEYIQEQGYEIVTIPELLKDVFPQ